MRRILLALLALTLVTTAPAQKKNTTIAKNKAKTTAPQKSAAGKTTQTKKTVTYSNASIKNLQGQRSQIQKQIKQQEQRLRANRADVKKQLASLIALNTQIDERQKNIEGIQKDISAIEGDMNILKSQLQTLEQQLAERKSKYIKSMRYMARNSSIQDKLMFVFSARSLVQMYRRLRFVREYADYQKAQGEMVKAKQAQVDSKHRQLAAVRGRKSSLLYKGKKEQTALVGQQDEQKKVVASLQNQQKTIERVIAEQRQKDAALNVQIDRLVAIEVEKARQRAAAEARRREAAAEAARQRAAELARQKAAAEAAARENARRIAEAKAREAKLRAEAEAAARAAEEAREAAATAAAQKAQRQRAEQLARETAERKAATEQAAREAESARMAAERKAKVDEDRQAREIAQATKAADEARKLSTVDRMLSGGFEANRGRLPMPVTGSYKIVSHYGQYRVEGLKNVSLDNKGINIMGSPGCRARSIYDGEVSAVFGFSGSMVVMVRHGAYISVYCNLQSVSVTRGQKVSVRQALGTVGTDNILQFQLRKETAKLNPEEWIGR